MIVEIARWTLIIFGMFFIFVGAIMFFKPNMARATLRKAGSTNLVNYAEITIRMIPATAFIIFSDYLIYGNIFKLFGWFMLITSVVLYVVPRKSHHNFSNKAADILKPFYFRLISPFAISVGILIIIVVTQKI